MLVLTRKVNESIVIDNDITVAVVEIRGDKVRLGIVAPKEVPVHRQEVYEAIRGQPPAQSVASPGTTLHPSADGLREYAHFILGRGDRSPSSDFWEHVKSCADCRRGLKEAIAAVEI